MSTQFALTINNEKLWNFYNEHPSLNFETTNLLFMDILKNFLHDANSSVNTNITSQLVDNVKQLQTQITTLTENNKNSQNETLMTFTYKLSEFKKDYIDEVKMILTNNVSEKVAPLVKEQNSIMLDKTHILINELLPKNNNEQIIKEFNESMKLLQNSITEDTNKLLSSSTNQKNFDDFINNIDTKFSTALQSSQTLFGSTEQRLDSSIKEIKASTDTQLNYLKELTSSNQNITSSLNNSVSDLLKKMENSSTKGKLSENILFNSLHSLYPCSQIDHVGTTKETGDIILTRNNKPKILIENKNWEKNVVQEEVKKFIHDTEKNDCCGLFLSQNYGIANKENFQIDISGKNILVYLHEVNNDAEKIKVAISIIDHFKEKLDELDNNEEVDTISKELLNTINREYQNYSVQKLNMIKLIKDCNQKMLKQMDDIQIPSLNDYLSSRYAFSTSKFTCEFCNYVAKNQSSMSAHKRGCSVKKNINEQKTVENSTTIETVPMIQPLMVGDLEIPEVQPQKVILTTEKSKKDSKKDSKKKV